MGTPLQEAYDAFFIKAGNRFLYKEDQVFQFFKTGIAKSKKTVSTDSTYLNYTVDTDNVLLTVYEVAEYDGDINIKINDNTYTIALLDSDAKTSIIDKIKTAIENDWTVDVTYIANPRLKITKSGVDSITVTITDTDDTNVYIVANRTYDGEFINTIEQDALELIALNMLLEQKRQRMSELDGQKSYIGTKDFNRLPDKKAEHDTLSKSIKNLEEEIFVFKQEFYSYEN